VRTDDNREKLLEYLQAHDLRLTASTLFLAMDELGTELELLPFQEPIPVEAAPSVPEPVPVAAPTITSTRQPYAFRNGQRIEIGNPRSI
jgi:hypothetical protein